MSCYRDPPWGYQDAIGSRFGEWSEPCRQSPAGSEGRDPRSPVIYKNMEQAFDDFLQPLSTWRAAPRQEGAGPSDKPGHPPQKPRGRVQVGGVVSEDAAYSVQNGRSRPREQDFGGAPAAPPRGRVRRQVKVWEERLSSEDGSLLLDDRGGRQRPAGGIRPGSARDEPRTRCDSALQPSAAHREGQTESRHRPDAEDAAFFPPSSYYARSPDNLHDAEARASRRNSALQPSAGRREGQAESRHRFDAEDAALFPPSPDSTRSPDGLRGAEPRGARGNSASAECRGGRTGTRRPEAEHALFSPSSHPALRNPDGPRTRCGSALQPPASARLRDGQTAARSRPEAFFSPSSDSARNPDDLHGAEARIRRNSALQPSAGYREGQTESRRRPDAEDAAVFPPSSYYARSPDDLHGAESRAPRCNSALQPSAGQREGQTESRRRPDAEDAAFFPPSSYSARGPEDPRDDQRTRRDAALRPPASATFRESQAAARRFQPEAQPAAFFSSPSSDSSPFDTRDAGPHARHDSHAAPQPADDPRATRRPAAWPGADPSSASGAELQARRHSALQPSDSRARGEGQPAARCRPDAEPAVRGRNSAGYRGGQTAPRRPLRVEAEDAAYSPPSPSSARNPATRRNSAQQQPSAGGREGKPASRRRPEVEEPAALLSPSSYSFGNPDEPPAPARLRRAEDAGGFHPPSSCFGRKSDEPRTRRNAAQPPPASVPPQPCSARAALAPRDPNAAGAGQLPGAKADAGRQRRHSLIQSLSDPSVDVEASAFLRELDAGRRRWAPALREGEEDRRSGAGLEQGGGGGGSQKHGRHPGDAGHPPSPAASPASSRSSTGRSSAGGGRGGPYPSEVSGAQWGRVPVAAGLSERPAPRGVAWADAAADAAACCVVPAQLALCLRELDASAGREARRAAALLASRSLTRRQLADELKHCLDAHHRRGAAIIQASKIANRIMSADQTKVCPSCLVSFPVLTILWVALQCIVQAKKT
ncbi:hypothetical protein DIPPA_07256 [Diplonema papillatum]|nr:hypothetical protein DIPPA_07256 [Diplonema papillatum]